MVFLGHRRLWSLVSLGSALVALGVVVADVATTTATEDAPGTAVCASVGKMKQVQVSQFNAEDSLSTLSVVHAEIPKPEKDQLLIRMTYMAVNPADVYSVMGLYPGFQPQSLPAVPGLEGTGVVTVIGPKTKIPRDLKGLKEGSRVVPLMIERNPPLGAWSEYILANVADVILVPDSVTDEAAAQLVVNPITALGMLEMINPPKGSYLLQGAGGSALGKQLIQMANDRGVSVISTVRRCDQVPELEAYGSGVAKAKNAVVCTTAETVVDIVAKVLEITNGTGAFGAVDPIAGDITAVFQNAVRNHGMVLIYGLLSGSVTYKGDVTAALFRGVTTTGYWVALDLLSRTSVGRRMFMKRTMSFLEKGVVVPHTGKVFFLDQVKEAIQEANRPGRSSDGKVLLKTRPECVKGSNGGKGKDEL